MSEAPPPQAQKKSISKPYLDTRKTASGMKRMGVSSNSGTKYCISYFTCTVVPYLHTHNVMYVSRPFAQAQSTWYRVCV